MIAEYAGDTVQLECSHTFCVQCVLKVWPLIDDFLFSMTSRETIWSSCMVAAGEGGGLNLFFVSVDVIAGHACGQ